jgi:hypothetical protein
MTVAMAARVAEFCHLPKARKVQKLDGRRYAMDDVDTSQSTSSD